MTKCPQCGIERKGISTTCSICGCKPDPKKPDTPAPTAVPPPNTRPNPKLKACDDCKQLISHNAKLCPHCGAKKKKTPVGCAVVLAFLLACFIIGVIQSNIGSPSVPSSPSSASSSVVERGTPLDIRVTSTMVKKVGEKYRYFFLVKNHDSVSFNGKADITILNNQPGVKNGESSFGTTKIMEPEGGSVVYMDINTAPVHLSGDWGTKAFSYVIYSDGKIVSEGTSLITEQFDPVTY